jgi:glutamate/tyrosine decarboxylase-like PLP-dependent enzyme
MDMQASYLTRDNDQFRHPGAYVPELSRRARGFAAWAMMRRLGRSGIAKMVDDDIRIAQTMAQGMAQIPGVTVLNQPELNQFIVRFGAERGEAEGDRLTQATVDQIQQDAVAYMGTALWRGRLIMRVSVSSIATTDEDGRITVEAVRKAWEAVQAAA